MSKRISPAELIQSGINGLATVANLDPRDPRTKNFKRAVAVNIGQAHPRAEKHASELSRLRGHRTMDWETAFSESLPEALNSNVKTAVEKSLAAADGDPMLATVHAVGTFINPVLGTVDDDVADEFVRRVVVEISRT